MTSGQRAYRFFHDKIPFDGKDRSSAYPDPHPPPCRSLLADAGQDAREHPDAHKNAQDNASDVFRVQVAQSPANWIEQDQSPSLAVQVSCEQCT